MVRFFLIALVCANAAAADSQKAAAAPVAARTVDNVILIGWDGTRRQDVEDMLAKGSLPNLSRLIDEGGLVATEVTTGATETKPGWSEILTGRSADLMGIESNDAYKPIPRGYTTFEILKARFQNKISTIFIGGKINNLGYRGPHEICINCQTRMPPGYEKTYYWDKELIKPSARTYCDLPRRWVPRDGEPYFNTVKALDLHRIGLGPAENVGKEAVAALERYHGSRFFAFIHFEDPDEQGHQHGENSKEYDEAIQTADLWLGTIVEKLKSLGIYDRTAVFITTDHGFDKGRQSHICAPDTFVATNLKRPLRAGDRKDVAPTLLQAFGIDPAGIRPKLDGKSLFAP